MENQKTVLEVLSIVDSEDQPVVSRPLTDVIAGSIEKISLSRYGLEYVAAPCAVLAWN